MDWRSSPDDDESATGLGVEAWIIGGLIVLGYVVAGLAALDWLRAWL